MNESSIKSAGKSASKSVRKSVRKSARKSTSKSSRKSSRKSASKSSSKSAIKNITIVLKDYIENIKLYRYDQFVDTLCAFRMYKPIFDHESIERPDIYYFITQLFSFDRNNFNLLYSNRDTILEYIIICGLFTEFEELLENLNNKEDKIDCDKKDIKLFDDKKSKIPHLKNIKIKDNEKIDNFRNVLNTELKHFTTKNVNENELIKFLFYCVCIKPKTRNYILRHFLLTFIKSPSFQKYKHIVLNSLADTVEDGEDDQNLINTYLSIVGNFKLLPRPDIKFIKKNNIEYNITTCAESSILNVLNYFFINDKGEFINDQLNDYSDDLINFYKKYDTLKKQFENIHQTFEDWLKIVSNLDNFDDELYKYTGDIHARPTNVLFVLNYLLKSNENSIGDIIFILNKHKNYEKIVVERNDTTFRIIINDNFLLNTSNGHAITEIKYEKYTTSVDFDDDDCKTLYDNIFNTYDIDEQIFSISDEQLNEGIIIKYLKTISKFQIKDFPKTSVLFKMENLKELIICFNKPLRKLLFPLKNLTKLDFSVVLPMITTFNKILGNSLDELTNLKNLKFSKIFNNGNKPLGNSLDELTNLEELTINEKFKEEILCSGKLKLNFLHLIKDDESPLDHIETIDINNETIDINNERWLCTVLG